MNDSDTRAGKRRDAQAALEELLRLMGFEGKVEAFDHGEQEALLHIECADAARLIGRKAQVLDALQFVLNRMLYRHGGRETRFVVDVERYRERRKDQVLREATGAIEEVRRTGKPVTLPVMTSGERRLVHHLVLDYPGLETHSEPTEEEGHKRVVISPARPTASAPEPGGVPDRAE